MTLFQFRRMRRVTVSEKEHGQEGRWESERE